MEDTGTRSWSCGIRRCGRLEDAADSRTFEVCARIGYAANGLLHFVVGIIAVSVAAGARGDIEGSGALEALADLPGGYMLLWTSFLGAGALAVFQLSEATFRWKHAGFLAEEGSTEGAGVLQPRPQAEQLPEFAQDKSRSKHPQPDSAQARGQRRRNVLPEDHAA